MKKIILITILVLISIGTRAEIKVTSILSDNMVLQRNEKVSVWGKATANSNVTVTFANQNIATKADKDGNWHIFLKKMNANITPQSMQIYEDGKLGKTIKNILIGEVWMVSGQSNMGLATRWCNGFEQLKASCNYPLIRYAAIKGFPQLENKEVEIENNTYWLDFSSKNVHLFSAVGCNFAINLFNELKNIPIGIIFTARGGASMTSFTPEDKISLNSFALKRYNNFLIQNSSYNYAQSKAKYDKELKEWEEAKRNKKPLPKKPIIPQRVSYLDGHNTPVYLYNVNIAPRIKFTTKGVLWYQGESDSGGEPLKNFSELLTLLINSWREKANNPNLNFIIVQLPSITPNKNNGWPTARWKQYKTALALNNCFLSNNIDQGEKDVHPKEKRIVAQRAANVTLHEVYNKKEILPYGPRFKRAIYSKNRAIVEFNLNKTTLITSNKITGFELKIGNKWIPASAKRVNDTIEVYTDKKDDTVCGVRYLWYNWAKPLVSLWGSNNVPALSFIDEV